MVQSEPVAVIPPLNSSSWTSVSATRLYRCQSAPPGIIAGWRVGCRTDGWIGRWRDVVRRCVFRRGKAGNLRKFFYLHSFFIVRAFISFKLEIHSCLITWERPQNMHPQTFCEGWYQGWCNSSLIPNSKNQLERPVSYVSKGTTYKEKHSHGKVVWLTENAWTRDKNWDDSETKNTETLQTISIRIFHYIYEH